MPAVMPPRPLSTLPLGPHLQNDPQALDDFNKTHDIVRELKIHELIAAGHAIVIIVPETTQMPPIDHLAEFYAPIVAQGTHAAAYVLSFRQEARAIAPPGPALWEAASAQALQILSRRHPT